MLSRQIGNGALMKTRRSLPRVSPPGRASRSRACLPTTRRDTWEGGDVWCAERNAGPEEVIRKGTEFYNLKVVCHVRLRCPASVTRVLSETPTS